MSGPGRETRGTRDNPVSDSHKCDCTRPGEGRPEDRVAYKHYDGTPPQPHSHGSPESPRNGPESREEGHQEGPGRGRLGDEQHQDGLSHSVPEGLHGGRRPSRKTCPHRAWVSEGAYASGRIRKGIFHRPSTTHSKVLVPVPTPNPSREGSFWGY